MKRVMIFLTVLAGLCLFGTASHAATVHVDVKDFFFDPGVINVNVGDTVEWENKGAVSHTSTSGSGCSSDGKWDSGLIAPGGTFQFTFNQSGTFPYFCTPHCAMGMVGSVVVNGQQPPPTTVHWSGAFSFPAKVTTTISDQSGNRKFKTSTQTFAGTISVITGPDLVADADGCFVKFTGNDGRTICINDEVLLTTAITKSKTDTLQLTGTGIFSGSETGPVYLDTKGTLKKDSAGDVTSISLIGKVAGGDVDELFTGNFKSTLSPL
jgi:plastocyanin